MPNQLQRLRICSCCSPYVPFGWCTQEADFDEARALPLLLASVSGCEVLHPHPDAASIESWYVHALNLRAPLHVIVFKI